MKKNLNMLILGGVLLVAITSIAYFQDANKNLQADLFKSQIESKEKIDQLEAEIENLKKEKSQALLSTNKNLPSSKNITPQTETKNSPTSTPVADTGTLNGPHLLSTP